MEVLTRRDQMASYIEQQAGREIGFVPTMGALHDGHISLVELCRSQCPVTVVSIFVNPTQFNDPNDLRNYPRTEEQDLLKLEQAGVDAVFMPTVEQMYPEPDTRQFDFGQTDKVMEGASRPGHFNGVAQVVSRLFDIVQPDKAYFGKKDFQQIAVIRAMIAQLGYNVEIVECPIKRDADGLALSSRNVLLTPEVRKVAPLIYATLKKAATMKATHTPAQIELWVTEQIDGSKLLKTIYFQIVNADTLQQIARWSDSPRTQGCIAVQAGGVRLIDNIEF